MSFSRIRLVVLTSWLASLMVVISVGLAFGLVASLWNGALLFLLGCIPAAMLLIVFRGAPPPTVAQVLYDADRTQTTPRVRLYAAHEPRDKP
jgi:hypothetical protein